MGSFDKELILDLLRSGQFELGFRKLLDWAESANGSSRREIQQLEIRYHELMINQRKGMISESNLRVEKNKIINSILEIIDSLIQAENNPSEKTLSNIIYILLISLFFTSGIMIFFTDLFHFKNANKYPSNQIPDSIAIEKTLDTLTDEKTTPITRNKPPIKPKVGEIDSLNVSIPQVADTTLSTEENNKARVPEFVNLIIKGIQLKKYIQINKISEEIAFDVNPNKSKTYLVLTLPQSSQSHMLFFTVGEGKYAYRDSIVIFPCLDSITLVIKNAGSSSHLEYADVPFSIKMCP